MHEQYRPFVINKRTQPPAMQRLELGGAAAAVAEIDAGINQIRRTVHDRLDGEIQETDEGDEDLIEKLNEMKAAIEEHYDVQPSLAQQLADAIASEQYELAAELRDQMGRKKRQNN
jgi:hypothetical protein